MLILLKKIKLRYTKYEFYTLVLLIPLSFFLFVALLNKQAANEKFNQRNGSFQIAEVLSVKSDYPEMETLSYEVLGTKIKISHLVGLRKERLVRKANAQIKLEGNKISIIEKIYLLENKSNTSNEFAYTILDINPNAVYKLRLINETIENKPQIVNINLDLKSQKKGLIILNNEAEVFKNLKYFVSK